MDTNKRKKGKIVVCTPTKLTSYDNEAISAAPSSGGKTNLLKHLYGGRLTRDQAIKAKCCDCMGYYTDGRVSCKMPNCPLFPFMPYKNKEESDGKANSETYEVPVE